MTTLVSPITTKPLVPAFRPLQDALSPYAEALVRVATGLFLMPHGAQKLFGLFGGYGLSATEQFFATKLGMPGEMALVVGLIEFFGGLALAVGFANPHRRRADRRHDGLSPWCRCIWPMASSGPAAATNIPCCGAFWP